MTLSLPRVGRTRVSATRAALASLGTSVTTDPPTPTRSQSLVDTVTGWLERRTSRRGFLATSGVVGSALAVDPFGYALRPGTAYASVCGPGSSCTSGWTVFCATINQGINACPTGTIAAGWWKADGAPLCGGGARYIVDCNAYCTRCNTPGGRAGICSPECWNCSCTCGPETSCDRRRVCCNGFRYGQCNNQERQVGAVVCRVVSCTPPWRFENCSTSPATDNRTTNHSSSELPTVFNGISRRYMAIGENGSVLGGTVYGQFRVAGGLAQRYENGRISASPWGIWESYGPVHARWVALGAEEGRMSFPVTPTVEVARGGLAQRFVRGRVSHHPETGTWEIFGPVHDHFRKLGAEAGVMGFPLIGTVPTDKGGLGQRFEGGRICWHPALGAFEVLEPVHLRYRAIGAEMSPLGYPISRTVEIAGGLAVRFQRGRISWSESTGAHEIVPPLEAKYRELGNEPGLLGFPLEPTAVVGPGVAQNFERGRLSWSPETGAHWIGTEIAQPYVNFSGGELGLFGFPLTDQVTNPDGTRSVTFQNGTLTYDPQTGAVLPFPTTTPTPEPTSTPTPDPESTPDPTASPSASPSGGTTPSPTPGSPGT